MATMPTPDDAGPVWLFLGTEPEDAQEVIDQQLSPLWPLLSQMLATVRTSGVQPKRAAAVGPASGYAFTINEARSGRDDAVPAMQTAGADADGCCTAQGEHCRYALTWWKHTDTTAKAQGVFFGMYTTGDQVGLLAMVQAPSGVREPPPAYVRGSLNEMLKDKGQFHVFRRAASLLKVSLEAWRVPLKVRAAVEQLVDPSARGLPDNAQIGRVWTVRPDTKRPRSPSPSPSRRDRDRERDEPNEEDECPRFISPVRRRLSEPPAGASAYDRRPPSVGYGVPSQGAGAPTPAPVRYPSPVMRRWNQQVAGY